MTDIEIIREQANIDIYNLHIAQKQGIITEFGRGKLEALEGIVDFIDSMQEELISEDLEEASYHFACKCHPLKTEYSTTSPNPEVIKAFKTGAKWKEEQIMKDTIKTNEDFEIEQRMKECPYRQVGCTMYEGKILECRGACSWIVDYPKLKELKASERK